MGGGGDKAKEASAKKKEEEKKKPPGPKPMGSNNKMAMKHVLQKNAKAKET